MSETDLDGLLAQIDKVLTRFAIEALNESQDNLIRNESFVTGFLHRSGRADLKFLEKEVVFDAPYSDDVEFGTPPKPVSLEALEKWARLKFRLDKKEARQVASAVKRKIEAEGADAHPYLRPAMDKLKKKIEEGDY